MNAVSELASKAVQTAKTPIDSGSARHPRQEIHRLFHISVKNSGDFPQLLHLEETPIAWLAAQPTAAR
jgi:hypothetical protein